MSDRNLMELVLAGATVAPAGPVHPQLDTILERLRDGIAVYRIAEELHVSPITIRGIRNRFGIPALAGSPSVDPVEHFWARAVPVDGGHRRWVGYRNGGTPSFRIHKRRISAYRTAFRLQYGREPVGYAVPGCDYPGCVAPPCMTDGPMRAAFAEILGGTG